MNLSSSHGPDLIRDHAATLPDAPGVYRMLDEAGKALYVGKAKSLKKRVMSYTALARLPRRLQRMVLATRGMEFVTVATEAEALLLEANLIKELKPHYNILLKDDKSYPYIEINPAHPFPRIAKFRGTKKKGRDYFGPFASTGAVNQSLAILQKAFLLRPCSDSYFKNRTRPCLQYQIKRCSAPCVGRITEGDYAALLASARDFLTGKSTEVQRRLSAQMDDASRRMDYEQAANLRDRIRALSAVQSEQRLQFRHIENADIVALAQDGPHCCIQFFFYRGGQNYGNRAFFLTLTDDQTPAELLAASLSQFYLSDQRASGESSPLRGARASGGDAHPAPKEIYLSHAPDDLPLLAEALSLKEGHAVALHVPKRGDKKEVVAFAARNAVDALRRKLSDEASTTALLESLARQFRLLKTPERIEVYDNSHLRGSHATGAMIAAGPEGFIKSGYRKFTIKAAQTDDDYGMMREVFTRRFSRLLKGNERETWPDLIFIDGGKGQLSAAMQALTEIGITDLPLVAVAKGPDRNAGRETFCLPGENPFSLPPHDATLHYIQRLRDEAHRYAIGTHRAKRSKAITASPLDEVPGIGPARKKALLRHFGSARAVQAASLADLQSAPGISAGMAQVIYDYFHAA